MKKLVIADKTLRECASNPAFSLSFREKTELVRLIDSLCPDVIELPVITDSKADELFAKTAAGAVVNAALSVRTALSVEEVEAAYECISKASKPLLSVAVPLSSVQMEYFCHMKAPKVLALITELVSAAVKLCPDTEFVALDAARAQTDVLASAVKAAIDAGASRITLSDDAGILTPSELTSLIKQLRSLVPETENCSLGIDVLDTIDLATALTVEAFASGVTATKCSVVGHNNLRLRKIVAFASARGAEYGFEIGCDTTRLGTVCDKIENMTHTRRSANSPFDSGVRDSADGEGYVVASDMDSLSEAVSAMGYELSLDEIAAVYKSYKRLVDKKGKVTSRELDALIADTDTDTPGYYSLVSYVINSGNIIAATANITLERNGEKLTGVFAGDGPVDASFMAIEQIVGHHFELDDYQIQSVTEGREAMGSCIVKLRSDSGRLYSGKGLSTDVIGASIKAYIHALNKIALEEEAK